MAAVTESLKGREEHDLLPGRAEAVLYGPQPSVRDQAENRLHAQKALMALVIS